MNYDKRLKHLSIWLILLILICSGCHPHKIVPTPREVHRELHLPGPPPPPTPSEVIDND